MSARALASEGFAKSSAFARSLISSSLFEMPSKARGSTVGGLPSVVSHIFFRSDQQLRQLHRIGDLLSAGVRWQPEIDELQVEIGLAGEAVDAKRGATITLSAHRDARDVLLGVRAAARFRGGPRRQVGADT